MQTIIDIIFEDFLTLYQNLFSPQGKRSLIISYKHGVSELPHELPNDLKLMTLENRKDQENLETSSNYNLVTSLPSKLKMFLLFVENC